MPFDPKKMDAAGKAAHLELDAMMACMSEGEHAGASKLIQWCKDNFLDAGYKRLWGPLVGSRRWIYIRDGLD